MMHLQQLVHRWIRAEARQQSDAEVHARAVLQALPAPLPRYDLVAAVMSALAPASLWSRRPVRYLVAATVLILGLGVVASVGSAPVLVSIASLTLWRDLASHLLLVIIDLGVDLVAVADTVWQAMAASPTAASFWAVAPWLGAVMFLAGTISMAWLSLWRDKENLKHA